MLLVEQQPKHRRKRASSRKHEGVRNPTARNAIVRTDEGYQARVDAARDEEISSLHLRINALELEVSRLKREGAVVSGYAAPLQADAGSNVVPMSVARAAKAEKESAVHVSHPLPVSGNEAHVLPSPSEAEQLPRKGNYEPKLVGKVDNISSVAANDEDVHPPEVDKTLSEISHLDSETVAQLADAYGMDVVEASEILYKEYSKREKQCYKDHGLPRDDVKLARLLRQRGQCVVGDGNYGVIHWIPTKDCESNFKDFWNETEARMNNLRGEAIARRVREWRNAANHAPLVKGEAAYRRKQFLKDRAAAKSPDRAAFSRVQNISRKLYVDGPGVTTASQWAAITTVAWAGYQKARKLLRMQPTVRGMAYRPGYAGETLPNEASGGTADLEKQFGIVPAADADKLPMRELVRRYQRAGIV